MAIFPVMGQSLPLRAFDTESLHVCTSFGRRWFHRGWFHWLALTPSVQLETHRTAHRTTGTIGNLCSVSRTLLRVSAVTSLCFCTAPASSIYSHGWFVSSFSGRDSQRGAGIADTAMSCRRGPPWHSPLRTSKSSTVVLNCVCQVLPLLVVGAPSGTDLPTIDESEMLEACVHLQAHS